MIEETEKAKQEYLAKKAEENKLKPQQQLAEEKEIEKALEIKKQILPTKVQIVEEDAFGFASSQSKDYGNENGGFIDEEPEEKDIGETIGLKMKALKNKLV